MFKSFVTCCLLGLLLFALPSMGQTKGENLVNTPVSEMSDAQIRLIIKEIEASGLGEGSLEQIAVARGMAPADIPLLRQRIEKIKKQDAATSGTRTSTRAVNSTSDNESETAATPQVNQKIFGAILFANANPTFEPNLRLATPVDYQLGPDDEVLIDIYGFSEANYQLKVSPEGTINIPLAGVVQVAGVTMEVATERIKSRLSKIYTGIRTGATSVSVSLGNIRSIKVVLTGEVVKPGTYTLPSVATVFNALYSSGGPTQNGSFRTIQIIRGGTIVATLDVYDFLLYGSLKNNIRLQDQDVIRVPTYRTRVEITGQVKREGIYEMLPSETLSDLIRFAGDFNEFAYKARVKVLKNTETERMIEDITADRFSSYTPSSGDQYFVDRILERFTNRVRINGALFRPGEYELTPGLTLKGLISKAEGLREDAFMNRGYISRTKDDLTSEMLTFNTRDILSGATEDIVLKREDAITIPSIFDLREEYSLTINGEVRNPGKFKYAENTTLEALILMAGGLREGATPKRIEIARRIRNTTSMNDTNNLAQVFYVNVDANLRETAGEFILRPFDIISVRPAPGYQVQKTVRIEGEVLFPGNYTITNKNERISDLIKRAGGLTTSAYGEGASLTRQFATKDQSDAEQERYRIQQFQALQRATNDSVQLDVNDLSVRNNNVGIDLPRIMLRPGRRYDLLLEDGDVIHVPKQLQTVRVTGEILAPLSVVYSPSYTFKDYINKSGGFSPRAMKKGSYIMYANGSVASTKGFLFFRSYPSVKPGAEIFVPVKPEKKNRLSTSEIVAISTGLATIATLIFTIVR